jgi:hypothetical protein
MAGSHSSKIGQAAKTRSRVSAHRDKAQRKGMLRVEVTVPRNDAPFIRRAAETLRGGGEEAKKLRRKMEEAVSLTTIKTGADLMAFLQSSPLAKYDIEFERDKSPVPPPRF